MASKRHLRRRQCESKKKYKNEKEVKTALVALIKGTGYSGGYYKCHFCKNYHIGRMPRRLKKAMNLKRRSQ
jgi:hypothetical protein